MQNSPGERICSWYLKEKWGLTKWRTFRVERTTYTNVLGWEEAQYIEMRLNQGAWETARCWMSCRGRQRLEYDLEGHINYCGPNQMGNYWRILRKCVCVCARTCICTHDITKTALREARSSSRAGFFNIGVIDILKQFFIMGANSVHCSIFNSISCFYPLDASSTTPPPQSRQSEVCSYIDQSCAESKITPVWG